MKNKRTYRTAKWYELEALTNLTDKETYDYYSQLKEQFGLATTTTESMVRQGMSKLEIRRYWKREYEITTGEYEKWRSLVYINNYIEALKKNNVSDEVINELNKAKRNVKKRLYLTYRLPAIPLWGYKNTKDEKLKYQYEEPSEQQLKENIKEVKGLLQKIKDGNYKEIDVDKFKK